jgi:lysophospholipase L1-like esterase
MILAGVGWSAFAPRQAQAAPTLYTLGDSTVQDYASTYYPRAGSGQMLKHFMDPARVTVVNQAVGGTSAKSFYDKYWPAVRDRIKAGDYVSIQFGINDAKRDDPLRYTVPFASFDDYLTLMVNEARARGAIPILVSPPNRNAWNATTPPTIYPSYHDYPVSVRRLAATLGVPLIDLDLSCQALLESIGQAYAERFIYMNLAAGEFPTYPKGNTDHVHFQEMGAIELARLLTQGMRMLGTDPAHAVDLAPLAAAIKPAYAVTFGSNNTLAGLVTRGASFSAGAPVTAKAWPAAGYRFARWTGDLTGVQPIASFKMPAAARRITAIFETAPYPAEDATVAGVGTVVEALHAGFRDRGYVNFPVNGGSLTFLNINGSMGGARTLRLRYALGGTTARTARLVVNGNAVPVTFKPSGTWTTWAWVEVAVQLNEGMSNTVELRSIGQDAANVDEMRVQ